MVGVRPQDGRAAMTWVPVTGEDNPYNEVWDDATLWDDLFEWNDGWLAEPENGNAWVEV